MNNDLISRSALLDDINFDRRAAKVHPQEMCERFERFCDYAEDLVEQTPAVDAEVVRHGRWYQKRMSVPKGKGQTYLVWACSLCHKHEKKRSDYCPNCGAKMMENRDV
jgi:hypothetical protein